MQKQDRTLQTSSAVVGGLAGYVLGTIAECFFTDFTSWKLGGLIGAAAGAIVGYKRTQQNSKTE